MKTLTIALAGSLIAVAASAQTASTPPARPTSPAVTAPMGTTTTTTTTPMTTAPTTTTPMTPGAGVNTSTGTPPGTGVVNRNTGPAAASGDRNQAVATTNANAPQPAHGRNSFTMGEARRRLERSGYAAVTDLKKDANGVWRGSATKDGAKTGIWLDYKGNIGTSQS